MDRPAAVPEHALSTRRPVDEPFADVVTRAPPGRVRQPAQRDRPLHGAALRAGDRVELCLEDLIRRGLAPHVHHFAQTRCAKVRRTVNAGDTEPAGPQRIPAQSPDRPRTLPHPGPRPDRACRRRAPEPPASSSKSMAVPPALRLGMVGTGPHPREVGHRDTGERREFGRFLIASQRPRPTSPRQSLAGGVPCRRGPSRRYRWRLEAHLPAAHHLRRPGVRPGRPAAVTARVQNNQRSGLRPRSGVARKAQAPRLFGGPTRVGVYGRLHGNGPDEPDPIRAGESAPPLRSPDGSTRPDQPEPPRHHR